MHEIGIKISAEVDGQKSITQLGDELEDMAKIASGDLQAALKGAADRMRELGTQDAAITAFTRLQAEANAAGRALKAAEAEAANYAKQVGRGAVMTREEADGQHRLQTAVNKAREAHLQSTAALKAAVGELTRYGIAGENVAQAQSRLRDEVELVRTSVAGIAPAYGRAAAGAQDAGNTMARTHRQMGDGVESIGQQLGRLQGVIAGLAGLYGFKAMATDLAQTADQVNNLQARLKLVTGEGEAFGTAWAGVQDVALRTNSALEETGTLFSRLAQAGKDAGQSTADATAGALALTETINQAIQLSGASAQASSAAITQLVQGLQGGVLRGDEFNSVMEQSPRLARALADGLGVTTGELRKMAEAGALTSETVIGALKGQSDTVAAEFSKLPATVGRALQNLSTQWQLYVAETDKATGASTAAATAINALAGNLQTIAGLLMDVGQAAAAFAALRLAQHFLGISTAAQQAAAATAAHNAQLVASGAAANAAAAGVGRVATVLASLRTFTLLGLVTNFKDIGTWIGEAAAKLAGYKDRTEELARADKLAAEIAKEAAADRARLAAAIQTAIDKQFELSNAVRAGIAEFDKLTKEGISAAAALEKVTKAFDLSKIEGIRDFSAALDKLAADGKVSAAELEGAWAKALNGKDLAQFEVTARAAFMGAAREGERVAQMMDAVLREAVRRTGQDFDVLQGKIGAASRSAINDVDAIINGLDKLKAAGIDTGRALTSSLVKAIDAADSGKALEAVRAQVEKVRSALGDKIADGLLDQAKAKAEALKDALDKATPGINSVREAMKALGITSDESLRKTADTAKEAYDTLAESGKASARELGEGFKKAAEAAIAANNGIAPAWVAASAAMRGFEVEVDKAGKSTLRLKDATDKAADAHGRAAKAIREQTTELERLNAQKEREIAAQEKANQLKEREIELYNKKWNMDSQHRSLDAEGKVREETGMPTGKKFVFDKAKTAGLSEEEALAFSDAFDLNRLKDRGSWGTPFVNMKKLDDAIEEAVMASIRKKAQKTETTEATTPRSVRPAQTAEPEAGRGAGAVQPVGAAVTRVVNIQIGGGRSFAVPTNAAGESSLKDVAHEVLKQLAIASGTYGGAR